MCKRLSNHSGKLGSSKAVSIAAFSDTVSDTKKPIMYSSSKGVLSKLEITPSNTNRYEDPIDFEHSSINEDLIDLRKKFDTFQTPAKSRRGEQSRIHGRFGREYDHSDMDIQSGVKSQRQPNLQREAGIRRMMALSR